MARVFISYRRGDARWAAGRLYDRLAETLGRDRVFFDVSNIEPGEDYQAKIIDIVGRCDILLTVIGPNWLGMRNKAGTARIEDPNDLMRLEVGTALSRNIRVIPILVDGAEMPEAHRLPSDLALLARRNAREISFERFHADLDSFLRVMQSILSGPASGAEAAQPPPQAQVPPPSAPERHERLPLSVSLETLGGTATALLKKGVSLPAKASEIFSTAEDNQSVVEVKLFLGERAIAQDNIALGTFALQGIPPAPRGVPQIRIQVDVDAMLVLKVSAEDLGTGRRQVLDAVDLSRIEIPQSLRAEAAEPLQAAESPRDSPLDLAQDASTTESGANIFGELFGDIFGAHRATAAKPSDYRLELVVSAAEAAAGAERALNVEGRTIKLKVPAGIRSGQVLRLRGAGAQADGKRGDLYVTITVQ